MKSSLWIKHTVSCRTARSFGPYLEEAKTLLPTATIIFLQNLTESSLCYVKITVVYNPVTLDPGKSINVFTSEGAV